jgi:hypothetical protein
LKRVPARFIAGSFQRSVTYDVIRPGNARARTPTGRDKSGAAEIGAQIDAIFVA